MRFFGFARGFRFAALFGFALALAACANNPDQNAAGAGGAGGPPG
ncbi:MAG: peptidoglycan-associated lipoprotein, partial [Rhizobiales bacterium 17-65-6]